MEKLVECPRCGGPRPLTSGFCPHCSVGSAGFARWIRSAIGAATLGTATACCASPVNEEPVGDAGLPDAGLDAGVDAGTVRCYRDAGSIGADYGIVVFPDGGDCE